MIRRAISDPISWLLVLLAAVISGAAVGLVRDLIASEACGREAERLLIVCQGGPALLAIIVTVLLALAAWCLVGMRAARLPR